MRSQLAFARRRLKTAPSVLVPVRCNAGGVGNTGETFQRGCLRCSWQMLGSFFCPFGEVIKNVLSGAWVYYGVINYTCQLKV